MLSVLLSLLVSTFTTGFISPLTKSIFLCESFSTARPLRQTGRHIYRQSSKGRLARHNKLLMIRGDGDTNPFYKGQDAYQILEVSRNADKKVIKLSYRKAISTWHPDKFPDDDTKKAEGNLRMEKINRAWYCLGDDDRKRRYDKFGDQGVGTSASSEEQIKAAGSPINTGGFRGGQVSGAVNINDIADIFDAFFGGADGVKGDGGFNQQQQKKPKNNNVPVKGDDMRVEVEIPFMTAIFGGTENINIRRLEECKTCSGSGKKPDARINPCSLCSGQGVIEKLRTSPFGGMSKDLQMCPNCRGSGENVEDYCHICQGKGAIFDTKEVLVHIPAGVEAGVTLRVRDSGNGGKKGGARGDLFVQLAVRKDSKFRREGIDIYTTEVISCFDAILGTTIRVDTVDGKIEVNIPMGTQPDQKIRIQGKGVPQLGSVGRGHAFLIMKVKIPTSISSKERELVEQIAELCGRERKDDSFSGLTDSN